MGWNKMNEIVVRGWKQTDWFSFYHSFKLGSNFDLSKSEKEGSSVLLTKYFPNKIQESTFMKSP